MLTYLQSIILGLVQGATELFPVSSLGHSVILPQLLGWKIDQSNGLFLVFLVATHLATSLVLLGFFFQDWVLIIRGIFRSLCQREIRADDTYAKLGWLIVIGTIPAGIIGLLFQDTLNGLFALPACAAAFLALNGVMLWAMERYKSHAQDRGDAGAYSDANDRSDARISRLSWVQSVKIGFAQCLALIPGFSRTGATLGGGLLIGLGHEDAARFSFLLATPIIFAAAVLKLPELASSASAEWGPVIAGSLASAIAAYVSVRFLTKYFKTKSLMPFAVYCIAAGVLASIVLAVRS